MSVTSARAFGLLAIASVVYYVLAVLAMHLLQPEFDPLNVPMSAYVSGAYGFLMTTTFFVLCAGLPGVGPRAVLSVVSIAGLLGVGQPVWAQSTIALYSGVAPGSGEWTFPETLVNLGEPIGPVITNVSRPTLTVFRPDPATDTKTGVIVAPGGAFHFVSMEAEGIMIGEWFRSRGMTAFVLKYRVLQTTPDHMDPKRLFGETVKQTLEETAPVFPLAVADARAALAYVRAHAADYGVLPNRVGMIGFSAGAMLAVHLALHSPEGQGPDFVASLYTGMNDLMRPLTVPKWAPPAFFAVASDDQLGFAPVSAELYIAWLGAARPAELHAYAQGGHGFALQSRGLPVDSWPQRLEDWLRSEGWLK